MQQSQAPGHSAQDLWSLDADHIQSSSTQTHKRASSDHRWVVDSFSHEKTTMGIPGRDETTPIIPINSKAPCPPDRSPVRVSDSSSKVRRDTPFSPSPCMVFFDSPVPPYHLRLRLMGRHRRLRRHRITTARGLLSLGQVVLIGDGLLLLLLGRHIARLQPRRRRRGQSVTGWELCVRRLLGRLHGRIRVDAILDARRRLGGIQTGLDEILALGLGHERLQLGRGEGVDQPRFRHDQQEDLRSGQHRQFIRLGSVNHG